MITGHRRRLPHRNWTRSVAWIVLSGLAIATPLSSPAALEPAARGGIAQAGAEGPGLAAGKFLVAGRNLRDTNFAKTVVLLLTYDRNGAMGLIINRPTALRLSSVFPKFGKFDAGRHKVFEGGPVSRDSLLMLVRSTIEPQESRHVFANVHVSTSLELLEQMIRNAEGQEDFRVFSGYAGWGAGQLDGEVQRDDWHVVDSDTAFVFDADPESTWLQLLPRDPTLWTGPHRGPDYGILPAVANSGLQSGSWKTGESIRFASSTSSPGG